MDITALIGSTIHKVEHLRKFSEYIRFHTSTGVYIMEHNQSCCESVYLDDVDEEYTEYLTDAKVLHAYESRSPVSIDELSRDTFTNDIELAQWTFYTIITNKGTVVLRWIGVSNGSYSVDVEFFLIGEDDDEDDEDPF